MQKEVTIMITGRSKNAQLLKQNIDLIREFNPETDFHLLVVDNSIDDNGLQEALADVPDVELVMGYPPLAGIPSNNVGSYRHAQALNRGVEFVKTPFLIIVDPDLYVPRSNWISLVLNRMKSRGLAFFGVPWHPRWYAKYQNFPCPQFFAVDLNQVDKNDLDFTPAILTHPHWSLAVIGGLSAEKNHITSDSVFTDMNMSKVSKIRTLFYRWVGYSIARIFSRVVSSHIFRLRIGTARDTGVWVWKKYACDKKLKVELLNPVVDLSVHLPQFPLLQNRFFRVFEGLIPSRWSVLAGFERIHYIKQCPFLQKNYLKKVGFETFLWQGMPFAFHLRGNIQEVAGHDVTKSDIRKLLKEVIWINYHPINKI